VTQVFPLEGRTSNVEFTTTANVDNSWIYLNYALINNDTEQAWDSAASELLSRLRQRWFLERRQPQ